MSSTKLTGAGSVSHRALDALSNDTNLPICTACGTQFSGPVQSCPICEDPRQFVPESGQSFTSLADLSATRVHHVTPDKEDGRISFISSEPGFGINQTPILIETSEGSYIWDCAASIGLPLISFLSSLKKPLKAIAISHPHFFATSLTWARALNVPLYLCEADRNWFQRLGDIKEDDQVIWWTGRKTVGPGVTLVQCGGHFPGSSILHWDRLSEPAPDINNLPTKPTPVSGIIFTADTIMVQPTQSKFTFIWSAPNMIPLGPHDVVKILEAVEDLPFHQATSTWPGRFIREGAKEVLVDSVASHLGRIGWKRTAGLGEDKVVPIF